MKNAAPNATAAATSPATATLPTVIRGTSRFASASRSPDRCSGPSRW
jgi:hypothetical protein